MQFCHAALILWAYCDLGLCGVLGFGNHLKCVCWLEGTAGGMPGYRLGRAGRVGDPELMETPDGKKKKNIFRGAML